MWKLLQRFSALEPATRGIFIGAAVLLPLIRVNLRLQGFRATQANLQRFVSFRAGINATPANAEVQELSTQIAARTARMVRAAVRHLWRRSSCLERSLVLWSLLAGQGVASEIRIGARKVSGKFEAHAWVEIGGIAVNEAEQTHSHYAVFDAEFSSLPEAG